MQARFFIPHYINYHRPNIRIRFDVDGAVVGGVTVACALHAYAVRRNWLDVV